MFPRNTRARLTCFKLPRRVAAARRSGKRCKLSDDRPVRVPQRALFLVSQDDLAFADSNSDFGALWPAAAPLRGRLCLFGVGRKLR
jgi:hypothetical protein